MGKSKGAHHRGTYHVDSRRVRAAANANPGTTCWRCGRTLAEHPPHRNGAPAHWTAGHIIDGDLAGPVDWSAALRGIDAVAHLAARVHVMRDRAADPPEAEEEQRALVVGERVRVRKQRRERALSFGMPSAHQQIEVTPEEWSSVMDVNVTGVWPLAAVRVMTEAGTNLEVVGPNRERPLHAAAAGGHASIAAILVSAGCEIDPQDADGNTPLITAVLNGQAGPVELLLAVGADWSMITRATGITPDEFATLKAQLNRFAAPHAGDDAQQTTAG